MAQGPLPGPVQEVPLAELFVLVVALRFVLPWPNGLFCFLHRLRLHYQLVGEGRAELHCNRVLRAVQWRQVYAMARSLLGGDGLSKLWLCNVKDHCSVPSCDGDLSLVFRRRGSCMSDAAAKQGARVHPLDPEILGPEISASFKFYKDFKYFRYIEYFKWTSQDLGFPDLKY